MTDIVERLRDFRSGHVSQLHLLMNEAASHIELLEAHSRSSASALAVIDSGLRNAVAEIERLRAYRDEAEAETAVARLLVARLRLTDAEREAVVFMLRHAAYAADIPAFPDSADYRLHHDALRGLLERME